MTKNLEPKNIERLLAEADELVQQIGSDAIIDMKEEHRLQFEKRAQNLKKIKSEVQGKIENKGTPENKFQRRGCTRGNPGSCESLEKLSFMIPDKRF